VQKWANIATVIGGAIVVVMFVCDYLGLFCPPWRSRAPPPEAAIEEPAPQPPERAPSRPQDWNIAGWVDGSEPRTDANRTFSYQTAPRDAAPPPPQPQPQMETRIVVLQDRPAWIERPSPRLLETAYPEREFNRGMEGHVRLSCTIMYDGRLDCGVDRATSDAFARAALRISQNYRVSPDTEGGHSTEGCKATLDISFTQRGRQSLDPGAWRCDIAVEHTYYAQR